MSRRHMVSFDTGVWDGGDGYDYRLTVTIDEARLGASSAVVRALCRRDGPTELANGGILIEAKRLPRPHNGPGLFGDGPKGLAGV